MTFTKFVVVGAVLFALFSFSSERSGREGISLGNVAAASTLREKARDRAGRIGARLLGPTVRSTLNDTQRTLTDLEPAIKRARPNEISRANKLRLRVAVTDTAALNALGRGQPIVAMKQALAGKQFVTVIRQIVAEEAVFR
jgi:hypothetical protein